MLSRFFDLAIIRRKLLFKKGATLDVTNSDNTVSSIDLAELAALDNIAASDLAKIDGITNGTAAAGKALVLDGSKGIATITSATITTLTSTSVNATSIDAGASGVVGSVDVFPATAAKGKLTIAKANNTNDETTTLTVDAHGQVTNVHIPDGGAADAYVVQSTAALSLAEADVLDAASSANNTTGKAAILGTNGAVTFAGAATLPGNVMAVLAGAGITDGSGTIYKTSVVKAGGIIKTSILLDLTGLGSSTTDLDIIGTGASVAHIGQITAANNGTLLTGRVTCLEVPAGGVDDIDLYSATEGTGVFDGAVTDLTEAAIVTSGAAWTLGAVKVFGAIPAADQYLYLAGGAAGTPGTYTAGKFLIEIEGY